MGFSDIYTFILRPKFVVLLSPPFDLLLSFLECLERVGVEALLSEAGIEALCDCIILIYGHFECLSRCSCGMRLEKGRAGPGRIVPVPSTSDRDSSSPDLFPVLRTQRELLYHHKAGAVAGGDGTPTA